LAEDSNARMQLERDQGARPKGGCLAPFFFDSNRPFRMAAKAEKMLDGEDPAKKASAVETNIP
jgi:hypothetical protein